MRIPPVYAYHVHHTYSGGSHLPYHHSHTWRRPCWLQQQYIQRHVTKERVSCSSVRCGMEGMSASHPDLAGTVPISQGGARHPKVHSSHAWTRQSYLFILTYRYGELSQSPVFKGWQDIVSDMLRFPVLCRKYIYRKVADKIRAYKHISRFLHQDLMQTRLVCKPCLYAPLIFLPGLYAHASTRGTRRSTTDYRYGGSLTMHRT